MLAALDELKLSSHCILLNYKPLALKNLLKLLNMIFNLNIFPNSARCTILNDFIYIALSNTIN